MPADLRLRSKKVAIVAAISLGLAGQATTTFGRSGNTDSPGDAAAGPKSTPSTSEAAKGVAPTAAPDPSTPVMIELKELKESVDAQAKQFEEHSQQLEAERAALKDEIARIAGLEARLGIVPDASASSTPSSRGAHRCSAPTLSRSAVRLTTPACTRT